MSYDIAVWEGERPHSIEEAQEIFESLVERFQGEDGSAPPTPAIERYVAALVAKWPDDDEHAPNGPWSSPPVIAGAGGPLVVIGVVFSRAKEVSAFAAELARKHGLVCFDAQVGGLR